MKKPELLAPAGNMEKLETAFLYGADAAYLAGKDFGLRARGGNFSEEELLRAARLAERLGKKIYAAVNALPRSGELAHLAEYLRFLDKSGVHGLIIADLGVWELARSHAPSLALHVSTQASTVNWAAAAHWENIGAARVVLARELSLPEIREIRQKTGVEIEVFVHGSMCIAYSGRCLLSSYLTGRDANQGNCAQTCRWRYRIEEERRPGEFFPVTEDERGTYVFNSRDLCLLEYLPALIESGVHSLKIEGRSKSVHYVATVVSVYRQAIDCYCAAPAAFAARDSWREELEKISHRPYTGGFIAGNPGSDGQMYESAACRQTHDFVGVVKGQAAGRLFIEQRNHVRRGDSLEILQPDGRLSEVSLSEMWGEDGAPIDAAPHPGQLFQAPCAYYVAAHSLVRRKKRRG